MDRQKMRSRIAIQVLNDFQKYNKEMLLEPDMCKLPIAESA